MSLYATLDDVKQEMLAEGAVDDKDVMRLIRQFSRRIDAKFKQYNLFVPTLEARVIPLSPQSINSWDRSLFLRTSQGAVSPLLSLSGASINGTALTVGTNVQLYPSGVAPYYQLQLMGDAWYSWYSVVCADVWGVQNASITGIWGYNIDYTRAWLAVDALAAAITTTTATTFTVANVDGDNPLGESPRISAGNVVQIDSEWMDVIATDITTNTVTVVRGVNGSTAATHLINAPVSVYLVDENIRRAVTRQVAAIYARRGAYNTVTISEVGITSFPPDILQEVNALLSLFANL